jgi:hypothetical protein
VKRFSVLLLLACCQSGETSNPKPAPTGSAPAVSGPVIVADPSAYAADITRLCDSVKLSGADQVPAGERNLPLANWLAANLQTKDSREFLVKIQPLVGDAKATALEAEAKRVGLQTCALAAEWR